MSPDSPAPGPPPPGPCPQLTSAVSTGSPPPGPCSQAHQACLHVCMHTCDTHTQTYFSEPVATPQNQDAHPQPRSQFRSLSMHRPSSWSGKTDRRPSPSEKSGRECWKVLLDRETSPSPTSHPAEGLETYSPPCCWREVALQGRNRPRSAARFAVTFGAGLQSWSSRVHRSQMEHRPPALSAQSPAVRPVAAQQL